MITRIARWLAQGSAHPWALVLWTAVMGLGYWLHEGSLMDSLVGGVSLVLLFALQHAGARDTAAIQAKLDELIRVTDRARNELAGMEKREGPLPPG